MGKSSKLNAVPDDGLLRRLSDLVGRSWRADADVVEHIAEVDARKLCAREAVPSMFAYCTQVLRLDEFEAYDRALDWLEEAWDVHAPGLPSLGSDPLWNPLRSDPRFQDLLRRMNLPQAEVGS
jgi:hypothetical protein